MSTQEPENTAGAPSSAPRTGPVDPPSTPEPKGPADPPAEQPAGKPANPLRHSRTSGLWVGVAFSILLLILLVVFIIQNTQSVVISFFGFEGEAPLAAALLIAAAGGLAIATIVGSLRIMQLRRRVKRESR